MLNIYVPSLFISNFCEDCYPKTDIAPFNNDTKQLIYLRVFQEYPLHSITRD